MSKLSSLKSLVSKVKKPAVAKTTTPTVKKTATVTNAGSKTTTRTTAGTKSAGKSTAKVTKNSSALTKTSAGSNALSTKKVTAGGVLNAIGGVGNLALTGLIAVPILGELLFPQELPTNPEDPTQEMFDQQAQEGGFLEQAEDTAEEILDPLSDVPLIGDAVDAASENGLSLPLLILILVLIGAAIFAAVKLIKKGRKPAGKRTRKPAKKGAAA